MKRALLLLSAVLSSSSFAASPQACGDANVALRCKATYAIQTSGGGTHDRVAHEQTARLFEVKDLSNTENNQPCAASAILGSNELSGDPLTRIYFQAIYMPKSDDLSYPVNEDSLFIYMLKDGDLNHPLENISLNQKSYSKTVSVEDNTNLEDAIRTVTYSCSVVRTR